MKKIRLIDEISNIDTRYIERTIEIDSKEKLINERKKEKVMKMNNLLKWGSVCLGCLCIAIVGVFTFNTKNDGGNNALIQIANPLTEVESVEEMSKYLGYNVPIIKNKEVSSYVVIGEDKYAEHARIVYKDNSQFEMEKGTNKDVSGIHGGKLKQKETINNYEVSMYTMEDILYATWSDSNYSYSYSIGSGNIEELINDIKLIK